MSLPPLVLFHPLELVQDLDLLLVSMDYLVVCKIFKQLNNEFSELQNTVPSLGASPRFRLAFGFNGLLGSLQNVPTTKQ